MSLLKEIPPISFSSITIFGIFYLIDSNDAICPAFIAIAINNERKIYCEPKDYCEFFESFPKLLANNFYGRPIKDESDP